MSDTSSCSWSISVVLLSLSLSLSLTFSLPLISKPLQQMLPFHIWGWENKLFFPHCTWGSAGRITFAAEPQMSLRLANQSHFFSLASAALLWGSHPRHWGCADALTWMRMSQQGSQVWPAEAEWNTIKYQETKSDETVIFISTTAGEVTMSWFLWSLSRAWKLISAEGWCGWCLTWSIVAAGNTVGHQTAVWFKWEYCALFNTWGMLCNVLLYLMLSLLPWRCATI